MSDLGTRIHALVEWTAPSIDGYEITRGAVARRPRWAAVLAVFVVVLVIGASSFVFGGWQPGDPVADATSIPVDVTDPVVVDDPVVTTTHGEEPIRQLTPVRIDCTSQLEAFPCSALVDGEVQTEWQAADGGAGAVLSFWFARPVEIGWIGFSNLLDPVRFARNHRISTVGIAMDDLAQVTFVELPDSNDHQLQVQMRSVRTSVVRITITGTYPGGRINGLEPFSELALAEVEFFGRGPAGEHFDVETALIIGIMESAPVPVLLSCASGPDRSGDVEGASFPTPELALQDFLGSFDGEPPIAGSGYVQLGQANGSIIYGKPLNESDELRDFVTLVTVRPQSENQWAVTSWEASGC
jgi:hypothetical protein